MRKPSTKVIATRLVFGPQRSHCAVSDPFNARYGQYLTDLEVRDLITPSDNTLTAVHEWLQRCAIPLDSLAYSPAKDWIKLTLPVQKVETLLKTIYGVYRHTDGDHLVRTTNWSIPIHLHEHIDAIQPTNSFLRLQPGRSTMKPVNPDLRPDQAGRFRFPSPKDRKPDNRTIAQVCNVSTVTPICLRTLYGTIDYQPQVSDKISIGLTNFLEEVSNRSDAKYFLERLRPDAVTAADTFKVVSINGGDDQQSPNTPAQSRKLKAQEGNLDAQTIIGICYPIPLTTFNIGGQPPFIAEKAMRKCTSSISKSAY